MNKELTLRSKDDLLTVLSRETKQIPLGNRGPVRGKYKRRMECSLTPFSHPRHSAQNQLFNLRLLLSDRAPMNRSIKFIYKLFSGRGECTRLDDEQIAFDRLRTGTCG